MRTLQHIHDIIGEIVDTIRQTDTITSSSESSGIYTIVSNNSLKANEMIVIDGIEYKVKSATTTQFTIRATTGQDFTGLTWKALAPYYMHEEQPKANNIISQKTGNNLKYKKYPLVLLLHPYEVDNSVYEYAQITGLNIALVDYTKQEWNSDQRYNNNFDPTLEPIYNDLIDGIKNDSRFTFEESTVPNTRVDNLFIDGNPLPDKLDGLLINFGTIPLLYDDICEGQTKQTYNLNLSVAEGSGTVKPYEGSQAQNIGSNVAVYADPDDNNTFDRWEFNGVVSLENPAIVTMNRTVNGLAYFVSSLITIQDVFSTIPININNRYYYENTIGENIKSEAQVVAFGNSITALNYPIFMDVKLRTYNGQPYKYSMIQEGVPGRSTAQMITDYPSQIAPLYDNSKVNILVINEGINDSSSGDQLMFEHFETLCAMAMDDGWIVILQTVTATYVNSILDDKSGINNLILANPQIANYIYNVQDRHPESLDPQNLTYYSDGIHWTDALANPIGDGIADFIQSDVVEIDAVKINNTQVARFEDTRLTIPNTYITSPQFKCIFRAEFQGATQQMILYNKRSALDFEMRMTVFATTSFGQLEAGIVTEDGFFGVTIPSIGLTGEWYEAEMTTDNNTLRITCKNIQTLLNDTFAEIPYTGTIINSGADHVLGQRSTSGVLKYYGEIGYFEINNEPFYLNAQKELKAYSKNGIEGVFSGVTSNLWSIKSDNVEPVSLTESTKLWTNDGGLTVLITPTSVTSITGYVEIDSFDNQGILKGLTNTYDGILKSGLELNADFDAIKSEPVSETFLKPNETENTIPQLIIKE